MWHVKFYLTRFLILGHLYDNCCLIALLLDGAGDQEKFYLLSSAIPEDKILRDKLKRMRLVRNELV